MRHILRNSNSNEGLIVMFGGLICILWTILIDVNDIRFYDDATWARRCCMMMIMNLIP